MLESKGQAWDPKRRGKTEHKEQRGESGTRTAGVLDRPKSVPERGTLVRGVSGNLRALEPEARREEVRR